MNWKELMSVYLGFTRRDRIGMMIVLTMIFLVFIAPKLYFLKSGPKLINADTSWVALVRGLEIPNDKLVKPHYPGNELRRGTTRSTGVFFHFDPNKLDSHGWAKLGLRASTIQTIRKFILKGGRFSIPEDLSKIYGLKKELVEQLIPFVRIDKSRIENNDLHVKKEFTTKKANAVSIVDINTADTTAFIALPGIGNKLAVRIINFRERLGGFYSIEQVAETFGLADSVFQKIKPLLQIRNPVIRKININTVSLEELKLHPYIRFQLAKVIIAYRNEHGRFKEIEELKMVISVTSEIYQKVNPYLEL